MNKCDKCGKFRRSGAPIHDVWLCDACFSRWTEWVTHNMDNLSSESKWFEAISSWVRRDVKRKAKKPNPYTLNQEYKPLVFKGCL